MSNPYAGLLSILGQTARAGAPTGIELGTVRTVDPITLYVGGTQITQGIAVSPELLPPTPEELAPYPEAFRLKPGDTVAVQRIGSVNILLCKVVKV